MLLETFLDQLSSLLPVFFGDARKHARPPKLQRKENLIKLSKILVSEINKQLRTFVILRTDEEERNQVSHLK